MTAREIAGAFVVSLVSASLVLASGPTRERLSAPASSGGSGGSGGGGSGVCAGAGTSGSLCVSEASGPLTVDAGIIMLKDSTINGILVGRGGGQDPQTVVISTSGMSNNTTGIRNVAIGDLALAANISGNDNFALGYSALKANTTGGNNVAIGKEALTSNTTGDDSVAIGLFALYNNTSGGHSVAIGDDALLENVSGGSNVAVGEAALRDNLQSESVGIGRYANLVNVNGNQNVSAGAYVAEFANHMSRSVVLGYEANYCYAEDGGDNNCFATDDTVALGWEAARWMRTGQRNVLIGTESGVGGDPAHAIVADTDGTLLGYRSTKSVIQATALNHFSCLGSECEVGTSGTVALGRPDGGDVVVIGSASSSTSDALQVTGSVYASGPLHSASTKTVGQVTLSTGTGTATVAAGAQCVCSDATAVNACRAVVSSTTLTITGTGSDVVNYLCL